MLLSTHHRKTRTGSHRQPARWDEYEPTALDVPNAHRHLFTAAEGIDALYWATAAVKKLVDRGTSADRRPLLDALRGRLGEQ